MHRTLSIILLLVTMLAAAPGARAQEDYRFDMGGGIGMTGYLGDANTANLMQNPSWDVELLFRYILNPRFNFKTNFYVGQTRGDSSQMTNVFPSGETYKFSTTFYELSELVEFHFLDYGMGASYQKLKRWTPYIAAGLGATLWGVDKHTYAGFTIPFGVGFKFKPSKRLNLGLEFLMKKVFSDRLDGENLRDPLMIKSGFAKNTDWYSTLTLTISYEFSKRCEVCHYKE